MEPTTLFKPTPGSIVPETTTNPDNSQFAGRSTYKSNAEPQIEGNALSNEAPSLKDRLTYPLRATKKRIMNMAGIGLAAGLCAPTIATGAVFGLAGNIFGSTIGKLIKCLFLPSSETSPGEFCAGVGFCAGTLLALPAGVVLGAVVAAAFAVIGLVSNMLTLPIDIYNAKTLNDKADLYPEPLMAKKIWEELKDFRFNSITESL